MLTNIDQDIAFELAVGYSVDADPDETDYPLGFKFVNDEVVDRGRWEIYHFIVFEYDGALYGFNYNEPATEHQEGQDRFEGDPVPVFPVTAHEVTTIEYRT